MNVRFDLPADLSASAPPEARGLARDQVRLLVAAPEGVHHTRFTNLGEHLRPGDLLVVNTSATLPAAVDGWRSGHRPVVVHFATELDDGSWVVELRAPGGPLLDGRAGERVSLAGEASLTLLAPMAPGAARLWRAAVSVEVGGLLTAAGRPIRYGYVPRAWPLSDYQTVFAREPGSAEMPSAARPFTPELVTRLVTEGGVVRPAGAAHGSVFPGGGGATPGGEVPGAPGNGSAGGVGQDPRRTGDSGGHDGGPGPGVGGSGGVGPRG